MLLDHTLQNLGENNALDFTLIYNAFIFLLSFFLLSSFSAGVVRQYTAESGLFVP